MAQLPKLDAVGSNPISRSIFSIIYRDSGALAEPTFRGNEAKETPELLDCMMLG
jgi:hypothetical protein